MRGSAIPRRWLISLALVGLVSLFAATLTTSWTDPSRASAATGTGTPTSTPTNTPTPTTPPANLTLGSVQLGPSNVNINPGVTLQLNYRFLNTNGEVNNDLPGLSPSFSKISGPGTVVHSSQPRTLEFTSSSTGTAVVRVMATQGSITRHFDATINIVAPAPTNTPAPTPSNPGPVPTSIPNADNVITPAGGGSASHPTDPKVTISVPPGASTDFIGATISEPSGDIPPDPTGTSFRVGSRVVNISFVDSSGNPITRLDRSVEICLPVSQDDIFDAAGGAGGLTIMRYDATAGEWIPLNGTYNPLTGQVCARSSQFSLFAVGLSTDFPETGGTGLPATGDTPLSAGLLSFLGLTGVALVGVGAVAFRRSRRAESAG